MSDPFDIQAMSEDIPEEMFDDPIKLLEWLSSKDSGSLNSSSASLRKGTRSSEKRGAKKRSSTKAKSSSSRLEKPDSGDSIDLLTDLRVALRTKLKDAGYFTVDQVKKASDVELLRIWGFGQEKVGEVRTAIFLYESKKHTKKAITSKDLANSLKEFASDLDYLNCCGLDYIDNRGKGGALWIIADKSDERILKPMKNAGMNLHYMPRGNRSTSGHPAWWTRDVYEAQPKEMLTKFEEGPSGLNERLQEEGRISVRSKTTGETTISVDEIVIAKPYGPSVSIDTYDNWYVCPMKFHQFTKYLNSDVFALVSEGDQQPKAIRLSAVTSVSEVDRGRYEIYVEIADERIVSTGKPREWYLDAFGADTVNVLGEDEGSPSQEIDESHTEETKITSPELIGLLYGIACDGRINIRETKMLKLWLDRNDDGSNEKVHEIKTLIEKVLDDDIVTWEEELEMLDLFERVANVVVPRAFPPV